MVNVEGQDQDMASPSSLFAKEQCHLLKIDREKFHSMVKLMMNEANREKEEFLSKERGFLSQISLENRLDLGEMLTKVVSIRSIVLS